MTQAEIVAAIYMIKSDTSNLHALSDWLGQYNFYVTQFKGIADNLEVQAAPQNFSSES
jgi:hypothetical protein